MAKGKLVKRSWAELPHEAVVLVAEELAKSEQSFPPAWATSARHAGHRRVWSVLMQAQVYQALQNVCREWENAINNAPFWWIAITTLDPFKEHEVHNRKSARNALSSSEIYRHIYNSSCIPCRLNSFYDSSGVGGSARMEQTPHASVIGCCAMHASHMFCFSCLQDAVPRPLNPTYLNPVALDRHGRWANAVLQRNFDTTTFDRQTKTLCYSCRYEELSKTIVNVFKGRDALKRALETIQCHKVIRDFTAGGVGDVESVVGAISEQFWLSDMDQYYDETIMNRYRAERERRMTRHGQISPEDDAEAVRLATNTKFLSVPRSEVLAVWARDRIMGGVWIAPYDTLHESFPMLEKEMDDARRDRRVTAHPYRELIPMWSTEYPLVSAAIPPCHSEQLWEDLATAFEQQFRSIIGEALVNCRLRIQAAADLRGLDAHRLVWTVTPEDLLSPEFLLAPENWAVRYNWPARYHALFPSAASDNGASPKSHHHGSSDATSSTSDERPSPTTTMQTTPSASPDIESKSLDGTSEMTPVPPPSSSSNRLFQTTPKTARQVITELADMDPTPDAERNMEPFEQVPNMPLSPSLMGPSVYKLMKELWRECLAPMFVCECSICWRTKEALQQEMRLLEQEQAAAKGKGHPTVDGENPSETDLLNRLMDVGDWSPYVDNRRGGRSPPIFSDEEDYDLDEDEEEEEDDDFDDELEEFADYKQTIIIDENGRKTYRTSYVVKSNLPPIPAPALSLAPSIGTPVLSPIPVGYAPSNMPQLRVAPPPIPPLATFDPRLAPTTGLAPGHLPQSTPSVLAPSTPIMHPISAVIPTLPLAPDVAVATGPFSAPCDPKIRLRSRTPGPPSLTLSSSQSPNKRHSRSRSPSSSSSTTSSSEDRHASKRHRSTSLERPVRVRVRDDEDVGGPDGEIVQAEDEHGHGRKRVKSFDGEDELGLEKDVIDATGRTDEALIDDGGVTT